MFIVIHNPVLETPGAAVNLMKLQFGEPWFANCDPDIGESLETWWPKATKNFEFNHPGKQLVAALVTPMMASADMVAFLKSKGIKVFVCDVKEV